MRRLIYDQFYVINPKILFLLLLLLLASNFIMYSIFNQLIGTLAGRHLVHTVLGLTMLVIFANINPRFWFQQAFWIYGGAIILLILVELFGSIGLGAQRWLDVFGFRFQPSELVKLALILALARYFQALNEQDLKKVTTYIVPLILAAVPFLLIVIQPDLGTSILILAIAVSMVFAAGLPSVYFAIGIGAGILGAIYLWLEVLLDYQKKRVLSFIDPSSDPAGASYHMVQSMIGIGSGGIFGKGFGQGSQSNLNFLPEKHTDFIFTVLAEQFGFLGVALIIMIQFSLIYLGFGYTREIVSTFPKLVAFGIITIFAIQTSINIAMVSGLLPVVGVPLPIFSYGGTSLLVTLMSFGIFFSCMQAMHEKTSKY